jgi:hypothetical protein
MTEMRAMSAASKLVLTLEPDMRIPYGKSNESYKTRDD